MEGIRILHFGFLKKTTVIRHSISAIFCFIAETEVCDCLPKTIYSIFLPNIPIFYSSYYQYNKSILVTPVIVRYPLDDMRPCKTPVSAVSLHRLSPVGFEAEVPSMRGRGRAKWTLQEMPFSLCKNIVTLHWRWRRHSRAKQWLHSAPSTTNCTTNCKERGQICSEKPKHSRLSKPSKGSIT